ncbi:MAG: zinc ribbon domain-containing protein [Dehalococcoidia bacterium]|nr:zinc ribbon domain-containing protein [Dehalococcoidia bacterium]
MSGGSGLGQSNSVSCSHCGKAHRAADNFCRQCGASLREQRLPSVRRKDVPDVWRPRVPGAVVRGAAFVAAGTVAEALVRRFVRGVFKRGAAARVPAKRPKGDVIREGAVPEDGQLISETFLLRRVRIRR